jgi:hypothetical protein
MVVKAIDKPTVSIKNKESVKEDVIKTEQTESTLTPLFMGSYSMAAANKESLDQYKFDLYDEDLKSLESSGWIQYDDSNNDDADDNTAYVSYRFDTVLTNYEKYNVVFTIKTVNEYERSADTYTFTVSQTSLSAVEGVTLRVEDSLPYCSENGCMNIHLTSSGILGGNYIITRTSEASNYTKWEDLIYLTYSNKKFNDTLIYQDFTIESGVKYKYAF